MKINIPRIIVAVPMDEYAPELAGQALQVWVNPPLDVLNLHARILAKTNENAGDDDLLKWYAVIWSQGVSTETHWSAEELHQVEAQDPAFLGWMISATWEARKAHLDRKKKA